MNMMTPNQRTGDECWGSVYGCRRPEMNHECCNKQRLEGTQQDLLWRRLYKYLRDVRQTEDKVDDAEGTMVASVLPHPLPILKGTVYHLQPVVQAPDLDHADFTLPFAFDSSNRWINGAPTLEQVDGYLKAPIRARGMSVGDIGILFAQLRAERQEGKPSHRFHEVKRAVDVPLPKRMRAKHPFRLPSIFVPESTEFTCNATPRHSYADIHADEGCGVLAWPLGSVKIWLAFQPETLEEKAMKRDDRFFGALLEKMIRESGEEAPEKPRLGVASEAVEQRASQGFHRFKGYPQHIVRGEGSETVSQFEQAGSSTFPNSVYIACTEGDTALFLPPGWKHVVYTLRGGYLGGATYVPLSEHLIAHAAGLMHALNVKRPNVLKKGPYDPITKLAVKAIQLLHRMEEVVQPIGTDVIDSTEKVVKPIGADVIVSAERLEQEMAGVLIHYEGSQDLFQQLNRLAVLVGKLRGREPNKYQQALKTKTQPSPLRTPSVGSRRSARLARLATEGEG